MSQPDHSFTTYSKEPPHLETHNAGTDDSAQDPPNLLRVAVPPADDRSEEEEEVEEHPKVIIKWQQGVLEEPCELSPFDQALAFRTSPECAHLRSQGYKSIHIAAMLGREEVFWWIARHSEELNARTHAGDTILHLAVSYGHESLVRRIFATYGDTKPSYEKHLDHLAKNIAKQSALHLASAHGHINLVEYLVDTMRLPIGDRDRDLQTPIMHAAQNGHLGIVEYFHRLRPSLLEERGEYKYSCLLWASLQGHLDVVNFCMQNGGSSAQATNLNNSAIHTACMGGHVDIVQYLLDDHGGEFHLDMKNLNGQTPLHLAAWAGHEPLVRLLITKYGAPTNITNNKGNTPLLLACLRGHLSVAKTLVEVGNSQFSEMNNTHNNALNLSAYGGHNDVIEWLLHEDTKSGLTVHDRTSSGNTPILQAASQNMEHTVILLVSQFGANMDDENYSYQNTEMLAAGFPSVLRLVNIWRAVQRVIKRHFEPTAP